MKSPWSIWFQPSALLIPGLFALAVGALFAFGIKGVDHYLFQIEVTSDTPGVIQLFYDIGRGHAEEDSISLPIESGPTPVRYEFQIPIGKVLGFRLDPIDSAANTIIAKPTIVDVERKEIVRFKVNNFSPLKDVEITNIDEASIAVTATGSDPSLLLSLSKPLYLGNRWIQLAVPVLLPVSLKAFFACWLTAGIIQTFGKDILRRLIRRAQNRPVATIIGISTLAVVIQCHPIIFFGRSFVSPDNGVLLLYDRSPTLPGYTTKGPENTQGSDVAALLHSALVYPSLQREALFRFGELPLWNRYSLGGLPLLGQGQSMFGSVLNLITLFGDSCPESWDLRYVLSRWLYAVGLGLATWLMTRHLGAAGVISGTGLYIGYFGFRLNHMAQLSLDLSPWILVGWSLLKTRIGARAGLVLFFANWEVMNSGTIKEAYILMLCLNLVGALVIIFSDLNLRQKIARIAVAGIVGVCLILISAPVWLVFLNALRTGFSHYDQPSVQQTPLWQILGFFDEIFYRRFHPEEAHVLPAINFALFAGVAWTLVKAREVWKQKDCVALSLSFLLTATVAFGVIPGAWLIKVPFINGIYHVNNTFSTSMVVLASILAGFGFKALWETAKTDEWWKGTAELAAIILCFFLVYHGRVPSLPGSQFYWGLSCSLCLALLLGHAAIRAGVQTQHYGLMIAGLGGALILTCWHHSQYLQTQFDRYVVKPGVRVSFHNPSDAVDYVSSALAQEPGRAVGLKSNVFAGFAQSLRWESIYGIDPVRNRYFDRLCDTADVRKKDWGDARNWHEDNLPFILPIQNLLNVRYYLDDHNPTPAEIPGLSWIASYDLDVFKSPGTWPRAFFTDRYITYNSPNEFVSLLRRNLDDRPFAAVENKDALSQLPPSALGELGNRTVTSATNYHMTSNTTGFMIQAPSAGLVVLSENYLERDFRVFLNETPVDYFRVNEACKGVWVPSAGIYHIRFEYWPHSLDLALTLMAAGITLFFAALLFRIYIGRSGKYHHLTQAEVNPG